MPKSDNPGCTKGSVIIISAPSGTGKSTLVKRLLASVPGFYFSVSHTTRPPRAGEKEGREYCFTNVRRFKAMIAAGEFAEWAEVFGHFYGTAWKQVRSAQESGKDILLDIDVKGHRKLRRKLPQAVSIFVVPPSSRELERRLRRRLSDRPEAIERRLREAREEIKHWPEYDYLVVNDRIGSATKALRAIVESARFRRHNQQVRVSEIAKTFGG